MDTFSPKGSIQWDFDFGRETKKPMISEDYLSWSPSKWSRWEDLNLWVYLNLYNWIIFNDYKWLYLGNWPYL